MRGTNFYVQTNYCEFCKRGDRIHIGKLSTGWRFALEVDPYSELYWDWKSFKKYIKDSIIVDEYEKEWTSKDFIRMIKDKVNMKRYCCADREHASRPDGPVDLCFFSFT